MSGVLTAANYCRREGGRGRGAELFACRVPSLPPAYVWLASGVVVIPTWLVRVPVMQVICLSVFLCAPLLLGCVRPELAANSCHF